MSKEFIVKSSRLSDGSKVYAVWFRNDVTQETALVCATENAAQAYDLQQQLDDVLRVFLEQHG